MTNATTEPCESCTQFTRHCNLSNGTSPRKSPCQFFTKTIATPPAPPTQPILTMTELEREAIEIALRFLAHNLKRCDITTLYYLPINSGFACLPEQAQAIETALEKIARD